MASKPKPVKKLTDRVLTYEEAEEFIRICDADDARKMAEYVERLEEVLKLQQRRIEELEMELYNLWQDPED
jgi:hypothetical protein